MKNVGVYLIVHKESGLAYVGQSNNIEKRWREHVKQLQNGTHHNRQLLDLWAKHGEPAFDFSVVCVGPDGLSPLRRQRWLAEKEKEIRTNMLIEGQALNVADPEIVETSAAYAEFKLNEKRIIKHEKQQIRETNKEVSTQIRTLESRLAALRRQLINAAGEVQHQKLAVEMARRLLRRNTGWRRPLLGTTDTRPEAELLHNLNATEAALSEVAVNATGA